MGSLFGGSTESEVKIPEWLEEQAKQNLQRAQNVASVGYTPYYGAEVAAFNPMQQAGFQNTADASSAFGLSAPSNAMAGMPQAQDFGGGVMGYSSAPLFEDAMSRFRNARPAQANLIDSFFIDPVNGGQTSGGFGSVNQSVPSGGGIGATGGMTEDSVFGAQPPRAVPDSTVNQPAYNQQAQQQIMQDELAQANQGLTPQAPSQFDQTMNALYPNVTQPITAETIGGMDFSSPFQGNVPEVTVDSLSQAGQFTPDYYAQAQDPSIMDRIGYGAESIGRNLLDNSSVGALTNLGNRIAPDTVTTGSLSDMIFGQQTPLSNSQLVAADGVNMFDGEMNQGFDDINQFLQDTSQYGQPNLQTQPQFETIMVNDRPVLEVPNEFYQMGSMIDQSSASQSPTRSLFEQLDEQQSLKDKAKEMEARRQNMFGRMR